jgi:hypothetical protein
VDSSYAVASGNPFLGAPNNGLHYSARYRAFFPLLPLTYGIPRDGPWVVYYNAAFIPPLGICMTFNSAFRFIKSSRTKLPGGIKTPD